MSTYEPRERRPAGDPQRQDEDRIQPRWCGPHADWQDGELRQRIARLTDAKKKHVPLKHIKHVILM